MLPAPRAADIFSFSRSRSFDSVIRRLAAVARQIQMITISVVSPSVEERLSRPGLVIFSLYIGIQ